MALTNTAATIPGFIVPVFVGELTHGDVSYILHNTKKLNCLRRLIPAKPRSVEEDILHHCWVLRSGNCDIFMAWVRRDTTVE